MSILITSGTEILQYTYAQDINEEKYYDFVYRPDDRENSKEYLQDDVIILPTFNGLYYVCTNPGISAATIPTFGTTVRSKTTDGTVVWKAQAYDFLLNTGDALSSSSWIGSTGVTIANDSNNTRKTWCKITEIPAEEEFTITNRVTVLRSDGKEEIYDRSITIPIAVL